MSLYTCITEITLLKLMKMYSEYCETGRSEKRIRSVVYNFWDLRVFSPWTEMKSFRSFWHFCLFVYSSCTHHVHLCVCVHIYDMCKSTFYIVTFCIGQPKQLLFLFIASLIYVPTSQFTKSVLLMTAAIIIVVFCGLAKAWGLLRGLLPKPLKGLRWIHCQNESPLSILFSVLLPRP